MLLVGEGRFLLGERTFLVLGETFPPKEGIFSLYLSRFSLPPGCVFERIST
jgi:hypothetical protein